MQTCDALIVGGGPAGSTCARALVAGGADVLVMDKAVFPRDKVCAGWITPSVIAELELDTSAYAAKRTFQPISSFRSGLIGGRTVDTAYDYPVSYGIRRCEFDEYLLQRSGARLLLGEKLSTIERAQGDWVINGAIRTSTLIGAGGHFCPVARHINTPDAHARGQAPREPVVAAQEIEWLMDPQQAERCAVQAGVPELYFCPDLLGYGWCVRKGAFLNIGLGREDAHLLGAHVSAFVRLMKQLARIPHEAPEAMHGHAYCLYGHARRTLAADGVLLIGDAAGLAYSQSGEGIRPAVESGLLAAGALLRAGTDARREAPAAYRAAVTGRFGKRAEGPPTPALPAKGLKARTAAALLGNAWFTRHVLLDRWFLHARQEALHAAAVPTDSASRQPAGLRQPR